LIIDIDPDTTLIANLRRQLEARNREIEQLNGQLAVYASGAIETAKDIAEAQAAVTSASRALQRIAEACGLPLDASVADIVAEIGRLRP